MQNIDLNSGTLRAIITFISVGGLTWAAFYMFEHYTGFNFFAEPVLILIAAGWSAYWVWKKTELGRY